MDKRELGAMRVGRLFLVASILLCQGHAPGCGPQGSLGIQDVQADLPGAAWSTSIQFTSPEEGAVVAWPVVEVAGIVQGTPCEDLLLNDVPIPWTPPIFSALVPLAVEGQNTITAGCGDSAATLTVVLDSLPPYLALVAPASGLVLPDLGPGDLVQVEGIAQDEAGVSVSVQGIPVPVDATTAAFAAPWSLAPGLNLVHAEATDGSANRSREHGPVLPGPFGECAPVPGRPDVVVRLSDGAVGLAAARAADELLVTDFAPLLAASNPVYDSEQLRVDLDSLVLEAPVVLETSAVEGSFAVDLFVGMVRVGGTLTFKSSGSQWSFTAELDGLSAAAAVIPSLVAGALSLAVEGVVVDAGEVKVAVKDQDGKAVVAPTEITGNFLAFFTDLLSSVLQDTADQAVLSAAAFAQGDAAFSLFGVDVKALYIPESIQVAGHQVTIGYLVDVQFPGDKAVTWPYGCPRLAGKAPLPPPPVDLATASFGLSLSQDFVNRTLTGLWTAGELFVVVDQPMLDANKLEVELVCGLAGTLVDLVTSPPSPEWPLAVHVTSALPPVFQPAGAAGTVGIALGGVHLELYASEPDGGSRLFSSIVLSLMLGVEATVGGSDLSFSLTLSDFFIELDQSMTQLQKRQAERDIESFFESLVPEMTNSLAASIVEYHLPLFYGAEVVQGKVAMSPEGYLVVQGRLVDKEGPP